MGSSKGGSTFDVVATSGFLCVNLLAARRHATTTHHRFIVRVYVGLTVDRAVHLLLLGRRLEPVIEWKPRELLARRSRLLRNNSSNSNRLSMFFPAAVHAILALYPNETWKKAIPAPIVAATAGSMSVELEASEESLLRPDPCMPRPR